MGDSDLPIAFEPDEALQAMLTHGRIIFNHPERKLNNQKEDIEPEPCDTVEAFYKPNYPFKRTWIPFQSLHVPVDPLPLDAVG